MGNIVGIDLGTTYSALAKYDDTGRPEIIDNKELIKRVSLYRDGEPLIDKKMPQRINKFFENGIKNTSIATNVSLLNEKKSRDLLEAGLGMIIFSIDSLKKDCLTVINLNIRLEL